MKNASKAKFLAAAIAGGALLLTACSDTGTASDVTTVYEPEAPTTEEVEAAEEIVDEVVEPTIPATLGDVTVSQYRDWWDENSSNLRESLTTAARENGESYKYSLSLVGKVNGSPLVTSELITVVNPDGSLLGQEVASIAEDSELALKEAEVDKRILCYSVADGGSCYNKDIDSPYFLAVQRDSRKNLIFPRYLNSPASQLFPIQGEYKASTSGSGTHKYVNGGLVDNVVTLLEENGLSPAGDLEVEGDARFSEKSFAEEDIIVIDVVKGRGTNKEPVEMRFSVKVGVEVTDAVAVPKIDPTAIEIPKKSPVIYPRF
jgi:hypothetical protein